MSSTLILRQWIAPKPIARPTVEPGLSRLPAIERAAQVLRFGVASAEYWVSPEGTVRALFRFSLKIALLAAIPAVLLGPIIILVVESVTYALALLANAAASLAALSLWLIAAVIGFTLLAALLRILIRRN